MQQDEVDAGLRRPVGESDKEMIQNTIDELAQGPYNRFIAFVPTPTATRKRKGRQSSSSSRTSNKRTTAKPNSSSRSGSGKPTSSSSKPRSASSSKSDTIELASDDDDVPPPKKRRRQYVEEEGTEDEGSEVQPAVIELVGYAYVEKPAKPTTGRGRKAAALEYTERGPFTFTSETTFPELLDIIAKALPCPRNNIVVDSLQAKPEHPSTAKLQGTHNSLGFKVLVDKLIALKAHQRIGHFYMKPPTKTANNEPHWDTGVKTEQPAVFDYETLKTDTAADSFQSQLRSLNEAISTEKTELLSTYAEGNFPHLHPTKRFYYDTDGDRYFELTDARITVWAKRMANGDVDIHTPPWNSQFFDNDQQYRIKKVTPAQSILIAPPSTPAPAPPAPAAPTPSIAETLMLAVLAQNSLSFGGLGTFGGLGGNTSVQQAPRAAPSPVKRHKVSIEQFVARYGLDEKDVGRLSSMDFRPGDAIKEELDNDARDAGFKTLSWGRVYAANITFKADLKAGVLGDEL
ncbi:hypothetical protein GGX14DRAFT_581181 [Mycena pura]|uniref:Uncharacterized protein n=1 Tax=Mycena pura TaxID=153505 RepID=A0AAD6UNP5_9AGAR|nr:hypothetical protein GGX14DRAFT_581181 [Mycena pura]